MCLTVIENIQLNNINIKKVNHLNDLGNWITTNGTHAEIQLKTLDPDNEIKDKIQLDPSLHNSSKKSSSNG